MSSSSSVQLSMGHNILESTEPAALWSSTEIHSFRRTINATWLVSITDRYIEADGCLIESINAVEDSIAKISGTLHSVPSDQSGNDADEERRASIWRLEFQHDTVWDDIEVTLASNPSASSSVNNYNEYCSRMGGGDNTLSPTGKEFPRRQDQEDPEPEWNKNLADNGCSWWDWWWAGDKKFNFHLIHIWDISEIVFLNGTAECLLLLLPLLILLLLCVLSYCILLWKLCAWTKARSLYERTIRNTYARVALSP